MCLIDLRATGAARNKLSSTAFDLDEIVVVGVIYNRDGKTLKNDKVIIALRIFYKIC